MVWVKRMKFSTKIKNKLSKFKLIPSYSEDVLFLTALAFILLYLTSPELRLSLYDFIFD